MTSPDNELPKLSPEQQLAVTAQYLRELRESESPLIPFDVFHAMAGLMVMTTVEVALVRRQEDRLQILLAQRPPTDKDWANMWHIPGSVVRGTDEVKHEHDFDMALDRAIGEARGTIEIVGAPVQYDMVRRSGSRGSENTPRFIATVMGDPEPGHGKFFDIEAVLQEPPEGGLIRSHHEAIEAVANHYNNYSQQERLKYEGY
jgi:hypothetical protein